MSNDVLDKAPTVLAFERKLDPSDALFYSGDWSHRDHGKDWRGIPVREKAVRGTISNRLKAKDQDPAKLDAAIENPNLQVVDVATLPRDADSLQAQFTLRILRGAGNPSACNNAAYRERLQQTIQSYVEEHGFRELARRYACNLANARWLWRNRMGAEQLEVRITRTVAGIAAKQWIFDALGVPLRTFEDTGSETDSLRELATVVELGLRGSEHVLLTVTAFARMGAGQEVYPSQELILNRDRGDKSKTLYSVDGIAAIHSQKLGNAIRTIDTWYPGSAELGPIAVEPYGSVTVEGKAYRQPKAKTDFYTLADNWILKGKVPPGGDQHYVMAVLVRGGVFGDGG